LRKKVRVIGHNALKKKGREKIRLDVGGRADS